MLFRSQALDLWSHLGSHQMLHIMVDFRFRKSQWQTYGESFCCILECTASSASSAIRAWCVSAPHVSSSIHFLTSRMVWKGASEHIRSENGPEFMAKGLREWLADTGAKNIYIEPGSPRENELDYEAWRSGKQKSLLTSPHPRPRRRVIELTFRATLTIH